MPSGWEDFEAGLARRIGALVDGATLRVLAPDALARPARVPVSGLRRLLGRTYADVAPWVELTRREDHLVGSCVSDHEQLGFPLSAAEKDVLHALGWHDPGPSDGPGLLRWFPDDVPSAAYLPDRDARAAAALAADTMRRVFGVTDPAALRVAASPDR